MGYRGIFPWDNAVGGGMVPPKTYERTAMIPPSGDPQRTIRVTMDDAMALRDAAILWLGHLERATGRADARIAAALDAVRREIAAARVPPEL